MSVKIITDSISDISVDAAEAFDIEVLPIEISLGNSYISSKDLSVEEMIEWIEHNKKIPEFKGISVERYEKVFEKYAKEGIEIVCVTADSKQISSFDCACHATTRFPNTNIQIIDTHRFSGNVGLVAVKAAKMASEGKSANEIAIKFERSIDKLKQYALMDSFDFLQYAGAVPKIVAMGNNLLNAKVGFGMNEGDNRDVDILGYSMKKAVGAFCKKAFKDLHSFDPSIIFLTHTISDDDYFSQVYKYVLDLDYFEEIVACKSGHFSTSFVGRNVMSITYQLK